MINVSHQNCSLPVNINGDYQNFFKQEHIKYLLSENWLRIESTFRRELQLHIVPGDLDNLIVYLREQKEDCLATFKQSGLVYNLWYKSFSSAQNRFDEITFLKKLCIVSDDNLDPNDLLSFFRYYCLNSMVEVILQKTLEMQKVKYSGTFNIFINNGKVTFGADETVKDSEDQEDDIILKNIIFKEKIFDTNSRLLLLRKIIAHAINMEEYNAMFGEPNHFTINPSVQSEWYYVMRAIEEAEIAKGLNVPKFIDQMLDWFPWLFNFETAEEMSKFKRKMAKSISHEKALWKYGKAKEVTKLKDMWARFNSLSIDYVKVERMYNAAYTGLYVKLVQLKQDIEKERAKH